MNRFLSLAWIAFSLLTFAVSAFAQICSHCGKEQSEMQSCSACKMAHYCNKTCQKQNWPAHKKACNKASHVESGSQVVSAEGIFGISLTTGPFRYPQMMEDWRQLEASRVLLLGAGMHLKSIPQLHELQSVYPDAVIHVVDNSDLIQNGMNESDYSATHPDFERMIAVESNFSEKSQKDRLKTWEKQVPQFLNTNKLSFFRGDFLTEVPLPIEQLGESYDVIVATKSIAYIMAIKDPMQRYSQLSHIGCLIFEKLAAGGRFYVETATLNYLISAMNHFEKLKSDRSGTGFEIGDQHFSVRWLGVWSREKRQDSPIISCSDGTFLSTDEIAVVTRDIPGY